MKLKFYDVGSLFSIFTYQEFLKKIIYRRYKSTRC